MGILGFGHDQCDSSGEAPYCQAMKTYISTDSLEISNEESIYKAKFRPYIKETEQLKLIPNSLSYPRKDFVPQVRLVKKCAQPSRPISTSISRQDSMQNQKTWSWPLIKPKQHFSISGRPLSVTNSYQLATLQDQCRPENRRVQSNHKFKPKANTKEEPLLSVFARHCNKDFNDYLTSVLNNCNRKHSNNNKMPQNLYSSEKIKEILNKYSNSPNESNKKNIPDFASSRYHNFKFGERNQNILKKELKSKFDAKLLKSEALSNVNTNEKHAFKNIIQNANAQTTLTSNNCNEDKGDTKLTDDIQDLADGDSDISSSSTDSITFIFLGDPTANHQDASQKSTDQESKPENSFVNSSVTQESFRQSLNSLSVDSLEKQPIKRRSTPRTLSLDSLATENLLMHLQCHLHPNLRLLNKRNINLTSFRTLQNKQERPRSNTVCSSPPIELNYNKCSSSTKLKDSTKSSSSSVSTQVVTSEINTKCTPTPIPKTSTELPIKNPPFSCSQQTQTFEEIQTKDSSKRQSEVVADVALVDFVCSVTDLMKEGVKLLRDIRLDHHCKRHRITSQGSSISSRESEGCSVSSANSNSSHSDILSDNSKNSSCQKQKVNGNDAKPITICKKCSRFPNRCAKKKLLLEKDTITVLNQLDSKKNVKRQNSETGSSKSESTTSDKSIKINPCSQEIIQELISKECETKAVVNSHVISSKEPKILCEDTSHIEPSTIQEISAKYSKLIDEMERLNEELSSRSTEEDVRKVDRVFSRDSGKISYADKEERHEQKMKAINQQRSPSKKQGQRTPPIVKAGVRYAVGKHADGSNGKTPNAISCGDGRTEFDDKQEGRLLFMKSYSAESNSEVKNAKAVKFNGKHSNTLPNKIRESEVSTNPKKPEKFLLPKERSSKPGKQSSAKRGSDVRTFDFPVTPSSVHPLFKGIDNQETCYSLESEISDWFLPDNYKSLPRYYHD